MVGDKLFLSFIFLKMSLFIKSKHDDALIQVHISCSSTKNEAPAIIIAHPYGPLGTC